MEQRKAFSFLKSFYEAAKLLQSKEEQADFLLAVCQYGLTGEEPEVSGVTAAMFQLVKPNLDSAIAKAAAGAKGGRSKGEANNKQTEANGSKDKANDKQKESKKEVNGSNPEAIKDKGLRIKDINIPPYSPPKGEDRKDDFDLFWKEYPRKAGKDAARVAFERAKKKGVTLDTLLEAVRKQKNSDQWTKDGGQFVPHPSTWLNQGRWQDELDYGGVNNGTANATGKNVDRKSSGFESEVEKFKTAVREAQERQRANAMGTLPSGGDSSGEGVRTTVNKPWEGNKV